MLVQILVGISTSGSGSGCAAFCGSIRLSHLPSHRCTGVHTSSSPSLNPLKFCILPGKEKFDCLPLSFRSGPLSPHEAINYQLPPPIGWVNPRGLPSPWFLYGKWSSLLSNLMFPALFSSLFLWPWGGIGGWGEGAVQILSSV